MVIFELLFFHLKQRRRRGQGESHLATQLARDPIRLIPNLAYPDLAWRPKDFKMELWKDLTGGVCVTLTEGGRGGFFCWGVV